MADSVQRRLEELSADVKERFERQRRVLSFQEFLGLVEAHPARFCRDAGTYVRDMFEFFGKEEVATSHGKTTRYRLFDLPFASEVERRDAALVGQERVQQEVARSLTHFGRVGHPNRVLLLHGPNGSAKSTFAGCVLRGLEAYSALEEGAVYRYHWVFPKKNSLRGAIGFGGERTAEPGLSSYAHLPDEELDARLFVEVRDHPLFLLPPEPREKLLRSLLGPHATIPRYLASGSLCDKSQKVYQSLLSAYGGSLDEVLRHVRVERVFFSRRYRVGAVTLGPELSVDARERQVTADQNLGSLPVSLQGLALYETSGELVDASGGVLELSDLLKRPLDAFRYLQLTAETGEVSLGSQTLQVNSVLLASANDVHLAAFRQHPEFASFRGRIELVRVPYLLDHTQEKTIYDRQVAARVSAHVAPHATAIAARFAVLTRLLQPSVDRHEPKDRALVEALTAWQKLQLYAGEFEEFSGHASEAGLRQLTARLAAEWDGSAVYEGADGASTRLMRTVLLDAAQHPDFAYLSPFAVLEELRRLLDKRDDFPFLGRKSESGGYHDYSGFLALLEAWLLDQIEDELRQASGLVDEQSYESLLSRYIEHLSASVKGEKLKNPVTGASDAPDVALLDSVERLFEEGSDGQRGVAVRGPEGRAALLGRIAAWSLDHPGEPVRKSEVLRDLGARMRKAVFLERQTALGRFCRLLVGAEAPNSEERPRVEAALSKLTSGHGYTELSAKDAAARLLSARFGGKSG